MREVLISIKPKWCELIASGKKTVEVRRTRPKCEVPFKCYIYCTMPKNKHDNLVLTPFGYDVGSESAYCNYTGNSNGKVIGEFVCDKIVEFPHEPYDPAFYETADLSCVGIDGLSEYLGHKDYGYGWHITDLVVYDEPRELSEFYSLCEKGNCHLCDWEREYDSCGCNRKKPITRPFQSWGYVYEKEN